VGDRAVFCGSRDWEGFACYEKLEGMFKVFIYARLVFVSLCIL
jgi:hypothetical protein